MAARTRRPFSRWLWLLGLAAALGASCTRERRHAVLTFFFDGVPSLNPAPLRRPKISPQFIRDTVGTVSQLNLVRHKPYADNQCEKCHPRERSFYLEQDYDRAGRCFRCHEHGAFELRLKSLEFLHGPVAVQNCLACHDPHESVDKGLLALPDPKLCYVCHERSRVLAKTDHLEGGSETCLRCHDPHGGSKAHFLRDPRGPDLGRSEKSGAPGPTGEPARPSVRPQQPGTVR